MREIIGTQRYEIDIKTDMSLAVQLMCSKHETVVCEKYRIFKLPKERDLLYGHLMSMGKLVYYEDIVACLPEKNLVEDLVTVLMDIRHDFMKKCDVVSAQRITEKLRSMGVVLMDRKGFSQWRVVDGEIANDNSR